MLSAKRVKAIGHLSGLMINQSPDEFMATWGLAPASDKLPAWAGTNEEVIILSNIRNIGILYRVNLGKKKSFATCFQKCQFTFSILKGDLS